MDLFVQNAPAKARNPARRPPPPSPGVYGPANGPSADRADRARGGRADGDPGHALRGKDELRRPAESPRSLRRQSSKPQSVVVGERSELTGNSR